MENYEKKYKEANDKIAARFGTNVAKEIFTDLYESEDERIRKAIIELVKQSSEILDLQNQSNMLAWLEKQGQTYTKRDVDDAFVEGMVYAKDELEKQGEKLPAGFYYVNSEGEKFYSDTFKYGDVILHIEKQGKQILSNSSNNGKDEQKPDDKVEPKFHKGQWIIWQNKCYKVNYNGCSYELIDQKGLSTSLEYGTVDKNAHLWSIHQDAKDGDVLYYKSDCGVEFIVMSKGVNKSNNIDSYFRYNSNDGFGIDIPNVFSAKQDNITPATKEQRDTLMKAMTDAGWEFDFEKKELKKIEKKSDEYSDTERQEMFIKSQRPHFWRPSDEQVKALKYVAYHLMPDTNYRKEMFSLYEDLKKLKE